MPAGPARTLAADAVRPKRLDTTLAVLVKPNAARRGMAAADRAVGIDLNGLARELGGEKDAGHRRIVRV